MEPDQTQARSLLKDALVNVMVREAWRDYVEEKKVKELNGIMSDADKHDKQYNSKLKKEPEY